ncbi:MAG: Spermidine/putrescine import ATP-binding protein PotA [Nitrospirae bacterium]|nr:Spermidine/putrescine import ATP-binding protein PotA [Nitrospirota bacterium]MCE7965801.1 ABC transporter ATP-binding protein [Nitrospira sp. NTP2]MCK6494542.1 ABC transporter ATP-binding protein [Nitrospira sp.]MEB2338534.1 ABC transporter ATP-binding protein [Nitrospirales bacterium]MCK6499500.1 ABC transporter ATP-binding protein [Nitrospira sp.]
MATQVDPSSLLPSSFRLDAPSAIDVRGVVRRHGGVTAVDQVSFQVRRGEFFSILGPSGAGKTSVLRILAGFEDPDEGDVLIEGRSMRGVPPNRRPVNLVFQSYALFPHLTVFENVAFGLKMRGLPTSAIAAQVRQALDLVKLTGKDARMPTQLSGGEQQRVALARALVNKPAVVLLDEPLSALDQQLRQHMQLELKAIQERAGLTCVCVTHHQEEAMMMSDRIAVMHQGRLWQVGSPREVYAQPCNLFVSRFLGVSNELPGKVVIQDRAGSFLYPNEGQPPVPIRSLVDTEAGCAAILSLRPEQLRLTRERPVTPDPCLPATIEKTLFAGGGTKYLVRVGPGRPWEVTCTSTPGGDAFQFGEAVFVQWRLADGRLFFE